MPNVDRCCQINEINPNHAMRFLQKSLLAFYLLYLRGHCRMSIQAINFYYSSSCLADHGRVKSLSECLLSYVAILNECYKNELYCLNAPGPPAFVHAGKQRFLSMNIAQKASSADIRSRA